MTELEDTYKAVRKALQALQAPWDFPPHLIWRLASMLVGEEVQYLDASIEGVSPRLFSSEVVAFTATRLVHARMTEGPTEPDPTSAATFTVTVATWSRASLMSVELVPDPTSWRNSDGGWTGLNLRESGHPAHPAVTIQYAGREPLTLPLLSSYSISEVRSSSAFSFLPLLLGDLATRPSGA